MSLMELRGITKKFPGVVALNNVNFSVEVGEILALVGENGAGKSTLMQILSGRYPCGSYDGEIRVLNKIQKFKTTKCSEKAGISMIYQELNTHLDMNVAENVFMGDWLKNSLGAISWKEMHTKTAELLARLGIKIDTHRKLRHLTNAEQQMVSICHALRKKPKILVMDEPTSTLPQKEVEILFSVVRKLKQEGITVILISHKMDEVFSLCDRLSILRNGEIVSSHDISDITLDEVVTKMIGKSISTMYPKEKCAIGEEVLRVENLTIKHPFSSNKNFVENISFTLRKGEILGLEGLVGSGRTEILNALYGKGEVVSGKIFIEGREVKHKKPQDAIKNGIAHITEERRTDGFIGLLNIRKNITLASLGSVNKFGVILSKLEQKIATKYMEMLNIKAPSMNTKVENLSGGNQQKVVISKCLLSEPKILFMDEPTRGIDIGAKSEIYKIMSDLAGKKMGIIMTSSERIELMKMTDRMIVLGGGKIQGELESCNYDEKVIVDMAVKS